MEFVEEAAVLSEALAASRVRAEQRFDKDVAVAAEIYRCGSDVYFSGRLAGSVACVCPRCLDEFDSPLTRDFSFLLVKDDGTMEADQGVDCYSGDEIDLDPLVREQTLLALDTGLRCSDDCRGLCAGCGANLNREACGCDEGGS
jgi:uncharacterized protein